MFWSTGLCRISRGKRWHISVPESIKGLTNALLVKNYLVSKIVKRESIPVITGNSSSIWFLFLGLMTRPHSYLCIVCCLLHPLSCLLRLLPIDLDRAHPLQRDRVESAWPLKFLELLLRDFVSRWLKRRWPRLRFSHLCSLLKQPERYRLGDYSYYSNISLLFNKVFINGSMQKKDIFDPF